jgi:hypothetical protein
MRHPVTHSGKKQERHGPTSINAGKVFRSKSTPTPNLQQGRLQFPRSMEGNRRVGAEDPHIHRDSWRGKFPILALPAVESVVEILSIRGVDETT